MVENEVLTRSYEVSPATLWNAVKQGLTTVTGATLKETNEEQRRATFTTGTSWTSWGENMVAMVESRQPSGAVLKVTGQPHTSFLTTGWGEKIHQNQFARDLTKAIERALG